jgi:hypothetical protein
MRRDIKLGKPQVFRAITSNLAKAGQCEGKFKQRKPLFIVVRPLDRAVVYFAAPRGSCEMMIAVVKTLDPRKDRRSLSPVELDTRLAAGAGHLKSSAYRANRSIILKYSRGFESLRHFRCCVLEILPTCQAARQLKILTVQGRLDPSKISGVGINFGLLVHVLSGPNKGRECIPRLL